MWRIAGVLAALPVAAQVAYKPVTPPALMPDGRPFVSWSDETRYTRAYHVSRHHPNASDDNDGSSERPLRTIDRAAQLVKPGERVVIHSGVYREMVRPRTGGTGPSAMIAYEAAPGEQVVISGSRVLEAEWKHSVDPKGARPGAHFSKRLWMAPLAASLWPDDYRAFATPNATVQELDLMPWAVDWKNRIPYSLPRGLIFQDGRRMTQLAAYEDLVRVPGSYWVAPDGKTVHIHCFDSVRPHGRRFEVAVQSHLFRPETTALGFIRISGLTFEHCANGFARVGVGAVNVMGGHHWIIENNTVREVNSVGIEVGFQTFEYDDKRFPPRKDPNLGHNIVRGNHVYECGTAGIRGLTVRNALVENNHIHHCGWQDAEYHWEVAGIKLLVNHETLVRGNYIHHIVGGDGIWLDWDNVNSRVTANVITDVVTVQGAIFIEASQLPNLVDNNVMWDIDGQGVRAADTDNLTVAHNLFGNVTDALVVARVATQRKLRGRWLTSTGNKVVNNLVVNPGRPLDMIEGNTAEHNPMLPAGTAELRGGVLDWKGTAPAAVPTGSVAVDFFGLPRSGTTTVPGPFSALTAGKATLRLATD